MMINNTFKKDLEEIKNILEQSRDQKSPFCQYLQQSENQQDQVIIKKFNKSLLSAINKKDLVNPENGEMINRIRRKLPTDSLFFKPGSAPKPAQIGTTRFTYLLDMLDSFFKGDSRGLMQFLNNPEHKDIKAVFEKNMKALMQVQERFAKVAGEINFCKIEISEENDSSVDLTQSILPGSLGESQFTGGISDTIYEGLNYFPINKKPAVDLTKSILPGDVDFYEEDDSSEDLTQSILPGSLGESQFTGGISDTIIGGFNYFSKPKKPTVDLTKSILPGDVDFYEEDDSSEDLTQSILPGSWSESQFTGGISDTIVEGLNYFSKPKKPTVDLTKSILPGDVDFYEEDDSSEDLTQSILPGSWSESQFTGGISDTIVEGLNYFPRHNKPTVDLAKSILPGDVDLNQTIYPWMLDVSDKELDLTVEKLPKENPFSELKQSILREDLNDVMRIFREKGLQMSIEYLHGELQLSYSLLKMISNASKEIDSQLLLTEYGNVVGHLLLNSDFIKKEYINIFTVNTLRCFLEATDSAVIENRKKILSDLASLKYDILYITSWVKLNDHHSTVHDFIHKTTDYQLFSDLVSTPNLIPDLYQSLLLQYHPSKAHTLTLFKDFDFEILKGKAFEELTLLEKLAFKSKEQFLQTAVAHAFDMKGTSEILWDGKSISEKAFNLEGQMNFQGLSQLKESLVSYSRSGKGSVSAAFMEAALSVMNIEFDTIKDFQTTTHHLQDDVARYVLTLPNHCATCMIGDKFFFKNNRGSRRSERGGDIPAGIEIFEIPEDQRSKMIEYLDKLKDERINLEKFEQIPVMFGCKKVNTIRTKEQSVGNCTFASMKLLLLSLCYYQHLEDNNYNHELALAFATKDYIEFVNFNRQDVLDRYRRQSPSVNKVFLEKVEEKHLEKVQQQVRYIDSMAEKKPGQALENLSQTICVARNNIQPMLMLERGRCVSFREMRGALAFDDTNPLKKRIANVFNV